MTAASHPCDAGHGPIPNSRAAVHGPLTVPLVLQYMALSLPLVLRYMALYLPLVLRYMALYPSRAAVHGPRLPSCAAVHGRIPPLVPVQGKAAMGLTRKLRTRPDAFKGDKVLFVHTGGLFGVFPKAEQMTGLADYIPPVSSLASFLAAPTA